MPKRGGRPPQTWRTFLRNQAAGIGVATIKGITDPAGRIRKLLRVYSACLVKRLGVCLRSVLTGVSYSNDRHPSCVGISFSIHALLYQWFVTTADRLAPEEKAHHTNREHHLSCFELIVQNSRHPPISGQRINIFFWDRSANKNPHGLFRLQASTHFAKPAIATVVGSVANIFASDLPNSLNEF